jgi:glutamate synthase (NADPH/NADH) small chain
MGNVKGFKEFNRELPSTREVETRVKDYKELYVEFPEEKTKNQAARCMDCGIPFCHSGCPLGNKIPDFNDAVYEENWAEAYNILDSTNNFPEFTGRICPAPCEGSCVLGLNNKPVSIEHIEKSIIEKAFDLDLVKAKIPTKKTGKKVSVIGSGPAGLAAADQLNTQGHQVTVYERDDEIGGLLRYGIPDFKLEKWVVERRVKLMKAAGVVFKTKSEVGKTVDAKELLDDSDAVVLCGGSTIPRDLPIDGRDLSGVHFAMEFLTQQNGIVSGKTLKKTQITAKGKNVIVIGGGDTGSDCVGTSNRHGAKSVTQIEILDKPPTERGEQNPWPEWPMTLRTSTSHAEGCDRSWSVLTKAFVGENGQLTGLKLVEVKWEAGKLQEIEGSEKILPCELVLLAAGFLHPQKEGMLENLGINLTDRGNVQDANYQTNLDKVFAAGDMRRGQSLVVWAIAEGRQAADAVGSFLS